MRGNRRWLALLAAALLAAGSFSGCGPQEVFSSGIKLETGEIQDDSIVIKVGNTGVKYSEVRNYCYLLKEQYEGNFGSQLWDYPLDKGMTIGDEAKEEVISMITQLKIIAATAASDKVTLTNDEKDEALQKAEELLDDATAEDRKNYALSLQGLVKLYEENALANKMFYIATDDADTEVSDEEAKQVRIAYLFIREGESEADQKNASGAAQNLCREAKKAKDFEKFAQEHTETDLMELTLGRDSRELGKQVTQAAFSLQKGQVSDVIHGKDGYYIICCMDDFDEDATYARREAIIEERQTDMFKTKYAEWLGDYEVNISKSFWKVFAV